MISEKSELWKYLSVGQKDLVRQGYFLLEDAKTHSPKHEVSDYSYLVFPFAKAYEGFLKQLFFDLGLIKRWQYESEHFRIGKALSPNLVKLLKKHSVYGQLIGRFGGADLANRLWKTWKQGRNELFHYFSHNLKAITLEEAEQIINEIVDTMIYAITISCVKTQTPSTIAVGFGRPRKADMNSAHTGLQL